MNWRYIAPQRSPFCYEGKCESSTWLYFHYFRNYHNINWNCTKKKFTIFHRPSQILETLVFPKQITTIYPIISFFLVHTAHMPFWRAIHQNQPFPFSTDSVLFAGECLINADLSTLSQPWNFGNWDCVKIVYPRMRDLHIKRVEFL